MAIIPLAPCDGLRRTGFDPRGASWLENAVHVAKCEMQLRVKHRPVYGIIKIN